MKIAVLLALLLGACGPAYGPAPCYPTFHTVDVDGHSYVETGVYEGAPPDDTIIPDADPPVGDLRPAQQDLAQPQSIFTNPDSP